MGIWIAVAIVLFVFGSMMALKPSGIDQRLDKLRMTARRLELNPKLVACPDWVKGKDNELGRGMLGQYGLVLDNVKMPHTRYQAIDGKWRPDSRVTDSTENSSQIATQIVSANFKLDKVLLALPASIEPFVKALLIKANSIVIYWEDIAYVRPSTNPGYKSFNIESDLLVLKSQLEQWALQMQSSSRDFHHNHDTSNNDTNSNVMNHKLSSEKADSKTLDNNF